MTGGVGAGEGLGGLASAWAFDEAMGAVWGMTGGAAGSEDGAEVVLLAGCGGGLDSNDA